MDENIDDIFYKGLDGKSIEKPDSYWDEMSSNVLKNSFLKPWWKTTTAYVSASILVVVTTVVVWISFDGKSTGNEQEMQTDPAKEEVILDSLKSSEESNKNAQELSKDSSIQQDFSDTESQIPEDKAADENQVKEFKEVLQPPITNERKEVKTEDQNPEVTSEDDREESKVNDSIQTADEVPADTLEQIKVPDESETVEEEKKPVIIIVQDTIVVTDTVKTGKKR